MTTWPDPERLLIARYLAGLGLRSTNSRTYYKQVLHSFQDVAERHAELGQDVLVAWLQISSDSWAASTRLHRTRIIDRFLDDLLQTGAIDLNPVAVLREACNIKQCKPVWRALASDSPVRALAELHQPKPFGSVLGGIMAEHVALMQIHGAARVALAVRPVPAVEPGAAGWVHRGDARTLGGGESHTQSRRRMRKVEAPPYEDTPSPESVDPAAPTGPAPAKGSGEALAQTSHLHARRRASDARYRPFLSFATGTASAAEHLYHAVAGLLRGSAAGRACPSRSG
jgi:hypothetical protein